MTLPLEDYALLGDCRGSALVSKQGGIDWWCVPRFDSPACFAALLGTREHGHFTIAPVEVVERTSRRYRGETLVLETLFETATGSVALIDCLLFDDDDDRLPQLVRVVEGRSGRVEMALELVLRFDYGSRVPWVTSDGDSLRAVAGPELVRLYTPVPTRGQDLRTRADFAVSAGERVPFTLTHAPSHLAKQVPLDAFEAL